MTITTRGQHALPRSETQGLVVLPRQQAYLANLDQPKAYLNGPLGVKTTALVTIVVIKIIKVGIVPYFHPILEVYYVKKVLNANVSQAKAKVEVLVEADHPKRQ